MNARLAASCGVVAILLGGVFVAHRVYAESKSAATNALEAFLWQKELKIYDGRAHGNLDFYLANTSPNFLAWPPISDKPIGNQGLKKTVTNVVGGHEVIKSEITGFTQDGDTAVIYYLNHRTMKADGTPADERFANIHVWIHRNADWVLLGGMSRLLSVAAKAP